MLPEILVVKNDAGYHLLHGHLRLMNVLTASPEAIVDASGEGKVKVVKTSEGLFIDRGNMRYPLMKSRD